jgi:hypothetical protein
MSNSVYTINKGINRSMEFRGLKAQYIGWLAGGLVALLLLFAIMYVAGVPAVVCIGLVLGAGFGLFQRVYKMSRRYGAHGMMKRRAAMRIPGVVRSRSRRVFMLEGE